MGSRGRWRVDDQQPSFSPWSWPFLIGMIFPHINLVGIGRE